MQSSLQSILVLNVCCLSFNPFDSLLSHAFGSCSWCLFLEKTFRTIYVLCVTTEFVVLFGGWERNTGSNQDSQQFIWTESAEMISNHVRSTLINVVWGQIDVHFDSTGRSCVPTKWQARVNYRMVCASLPVVMMKDNFIISKKTRLSKSFLPWNTEVPGNERRQNRVHSE